LIFTETKFDAGVKNCSEDLHFRIDGIKELWPSRTEVINFSAQDCAVVLLQIQNVTYFAILVSLILQ